MDATIKRMSKRGKGDIVANLYLDQTIEQLQKIVQHDNTIFSIRVYGNNVQNETKWYTRDAFLQKNNDF